jgi:transcription-repair coupling factor (superfamily II helicase)
MEKYSFEKAETEAEKMQGYIKDGHAENYSDAEKVVSRMANTYGEAPKEWKEFYIKMKELRGTLLHEILELDKENKEIYLRRLKEKEVSAISSVEDSNKYLAYHISLAGSTGPISSPKLDFEGEHSLLKFYEELLQELKA